MYLVKKIGAVLGPEYSAYLTIILSCVTWTFALMAGAEAHYGSSQYIGILRGVATSIFFFIMARSTSDNISYKSSSDFKIIVTRTLIMNIQQLLISYCLRYLQSSMVYTICNTGPIMVFIMDYFKNNTLVKPRQIAGIVVSSLGLLIAVNSLIISQWLGYESYTQNSRYTYEQSTIVFKIILCGVLFLEHVLWAYGIIITKDLKSTNSVQLSFISGVILTLVSAALYPFNPNTQTINIAQFAIDFVKIGLVLSISVYLYVSALFMTKNTGNVTIMGFSTVIFGYVISLVRYGQMPNIFGIIGSAGILIGLICILLKRQPKVQH